MTHRAIRLSLAAVLLLQLAAAAPAQTVLVYARADQAQAQRVARLAGVYDPVWLDQDLTPGTDWRRQVARRLLDAKCILVLWSARAAASLEVAAEWRIALATDPAVTRVMPVLLDDTPMPAELAARQAVDWR